MKNWKLKKIHRTHKKGFTLAELLVVVAIIAVLVAVSIPIFTSQLEKTREAVCLANARSLLAGFRVEQMSDSEEHNEHAWIKKAAESINGTYTSNGGADKIGGLCAYKDAYYSVTYDGTGGVSIICSKHGDIIGQYATQIIEQILPNVATITRKTNAGNQTLEDYFNDNRNQINSNAAKALSANVSWPTVINEKIGNISQTWALNRVNGSYEFMITESPLTNDDLGNFVPVIKYTVSSTGEVTKVTGTAPVSANSVKDPYLTIDLKKFVAS